MAKASQMVDTAFAHYRAGQLVQAETVCRRILLASSDNEDALHLFGLIAFASGRADLAVETMRKAISVHPARAELYRDFAAILLSLGRLDVAISSSRRAVCLNQSDAEAYFLIGQVTRQQGALAEAEAAFRTAVVHCPSHALVLMNLANLLQEQGRFDEAEFFYRETLRQKPDYAEAHKNFAVALSERGRLDEAEASIRQAIRFQPDEPGFRMALAQILLQAGRLEEGWKQYEWRWQTKNMPSRPRGFIQPLWTGTTENDRVLLLHAEQGFGDTVQFCRYVPLAAKKARVVLEVPRPLMSLLSTLPGIDHIVATGDPLPPFDIHCPLLSLPRVFRTTTTTIPNQVPYLRAEGRRVAVWEDRLSDLDGVRVGLVWAGGAVTPRNPQRSIAPGKLSILAGIPDVHFISLQKFQSAGSEQMPPRSLGIIDWTNDLGDFADTAALIKALDLVISVDTSVAHVAGALGKPVWLLNRFFPCWRWLSARDDSPWYPTLRQYRQRVLNDWDGVLRDVRRDLARLGADVPQTRLCKVTASVEKRVGSSHRRWNIQ